MPNIPIKTLWLVRHGESVGNIARHEAEKCSALQIDTPHREPDVELSPAGIEQAVQLGKWFAGGDSIPTVIYASPYFRAVETAKTLIENSDGKLNKLDVRLDERLREREFGVFDCLTKEGAEKKYPELCSLRERWGKFYFRPPGGESWADVVFRLRSFIATDLSTLADQRVLIITHEVVIRCFRYILENLTESQILAIDSLSDVENGAVTAYEFDSERTILTVDNFVPTSRNPER